MKYKELKEAKIYTVQIGISHPRDVRVFENPTPEQLVNMLRDDKFQSWRGILLEDERIIVWPAADSIHLNIQYWFDANEDLKSRLTLYMSLRPVLGGHKLMIDVEPASNGSLLKDNRWFQRMTKGFDIKFRWDAHREERANEV